MDPNLNKQDDNTTENENTEMPILDGCAPTEPLPVLEQEDCDECDGAYEDEYCNTCGTARPDDRMHYTINAGNGVAAACDRGIRHLTNEDAVAAWSHIDDDGNRRIAMVVADGVSTARRSERASEAAVNAAIDVLRNSSSLGVGELDAAFTDALEHRLTDAAQAASDAVATISHNIDDSPELSNIPKIGEPACTLVTVVVEGNHVAASSIGDSRAYWLPDINDDNEEEATLLTTDDSFANEQIRRGMSPQEAMRGPQAHTITAWLGLDAPDIELAVTHFTLESSGWLIVCSDGLWNYAAEPRHIHAALRHATNTLSDDAAPVDIAEALVAWANAHGGHDNITVALARIDC
ncbi:PP2C family protein-serine/threonine phosphatase [Dermatophilus congolensis]|uniref:Serine/threonine phosphatase stp n=1 Tax=Dermatophilus congolensis TaxID=1863 RepID=A0A239V4R3_9MICO|nr:PP2C family serine/threonine-protein phosphatase [Dermatophilus congolensis]MBO3131161.1 serine/threonine-protein phosphatase [Dermatophilus congolensis]MBO3139163.1 serine/threonine-protein phosphatase [Dermatophilus congolensis]MBO3148105.1 serine/threonine-protein phosphatase [Dermatophilus congolensis]MBO3150380.1 serine/threonine-protein phosphatase [Dermatophilus congolensis]MBO3180637.1 serine/threonine-protein phosphatase [Dermatophilus congolensis]